jgi:hypothetical protein
MHFRSYRDPGAYTYPNPYSYTAAGIVSSDLDPIKSRGRG